MSLLKSFKKSYHPRSKYYRLNYNITAPTVRLLDDTGVQIGVFSRDEALRRAREKGIDLVEIAPLAKPPVCKVIDFKKFKYLESKKERESKKKIKHVDIKQIMLSPFIGEHDLETKLNRGKEFLKVGHRLKIIVRFRGRQLGKQEFGFNLINKVINQLKDITLVDRPAHFEGQMLICQLSPSKKRIPSTSSGQELKKNVKSENNRSNKNETENPQSNSKTV